jgi:hypothetical protein
LEDNYYIDLKKISLSKYEKELETAELLPSRKIIQENLKNRFMILAEHGIKSLSDLLTTLKTPEKIKAFALKSGVPEDYLVILKREVASFLPKPVNLADFPGVSKAALVTLKKIGIKNTKELFDLVKTEASRKDLSRKIGISDKEILELTKLTDLSRIRWVGANFSRLLADSACDTLEKVANADYKTLYNAVIKINEEKKYFKGKFGLNDMKLCIIAAKSVPVAVKY